MDFKQNFTGDGVTYNMREAVVQGGMQRVCVLTGLSQLASRLGLMVTVQIGRLQPTLSVVSSVSMVPTLFCCS